MVSPVGERGTEVNWLWGLRPEGGEAGAVSGPWRLDLNGLVVAAQEAAVRNLPWWQRGVVKGLLVRKWGCVS